MKLRVLYEDGLVWVDLTLDSRFEDYRGHGHVEQSLVFGILDEIIWYSVVMQLGKISMTRLVTVNFYQPLLCHNSYRAMSKVTGVQDNDICVAAWVLDEQGKRYIEVEGIFKEARKVPVQDLLKNFDFAECSQDTKDFFYSLT